MGIATTTTKNQDVFCDCSGDTAGASSVASPLVNPTLLRALRRPRSPPNPAKKKKKKKNPTHTKKADSLFESKRVTT